MNAGARHRLVKSVEEHRRGCGPSFGLQAQRIERGFPKWAAAMFVPLADDADRPRVPVNIANLEVRNFACTRSGVKHEQQ